MLKLLEMVDSAGEDATRVEMNVALKELPDAMDRAVYVHERYPLVVDPSGQATRFLKYQRGSMLMAGNPADMAPESLRRHLVDAIKHGVLLVINLDMLSTIELDHFFAPDSFPAEVLVRQELFSAPVLAKILKPEASDPSVDDFLISDHFKLVVVCRFSPPPVQTAGRMCVINVSLQTQDDQGGAGQEGLAKALGVAKETKRNSLELVEAAFDNDMEVVVACLDKNYDLESQDGHSHTALSEAACQGNSDILKLLLERGADPNKCNDEKRSPLYRAAYNGHLETVRLLLESGADPRIATKQGETPFDVSKSKEVQELLTRWDLTTTDRLMEERRKVIEAKWKERITNHLEREQYAFMTICAELFEAAQKGKLDEIARQFEQLADEVVESGGRPRACADIRDDHGSTMLAIAAQFDHDELVTELVCKWKTLEQQGRELAVSSAASAQQLAAKRALVLSKIWKTNVNSRNCRGWTPVAIAVFHESKKSLRILLDNGADPSLKNQYNKDAYYFAKDDLDAAHNIVKSRAEIRQVLIDWENQRHTGNAVAAEPPAEEPTKESKTSPKKAKAKKTTSASTSPKKNAEKTLVKPKKAPTSGLPPKKKTQNHV